MRGGVAYRSKRRTRGPRRFFTSLLRVGVYALVLYSLVTGLLIRSYRIGSVSMAPSFEVGQRVFISPLVYGSRLPWGEGRLPGLRAPQRGDLVVLEPPYIGADGRIRRVLDPFVRFFTLGRLSAYRGPAEVRMTRVMMKRVIGLPGDTVRLEDYRAWIRPPGATEFTSEHNLIAARYQVISGRASDVAGRIPFGGDAEALTLGEGEYYVLGDNRRDSSDSRSWGAVDLSRILGRAILRYFPLRELGRI